jgi:mannose-6-phosphate isomerase-like protein (cupin superfamily)
MFKITAIMAQNPYLKRSANSISEVPTEISTTSTHFKPMFGLGDKDSEFVKGIKRYGYLTIDSCGKSNIVSYANEEQILFVLNGTGILHYNNINMPIAENDFMYIPVDTNFGISNPRDKPLTIVVMGFIIFPDTKIEPTPKLMIANTNEVIFQEVSGHGPTSLFQLLMGTTRSDRDRLAAAYQATSLFIMDFAEGGTNIPHRHRNEEEIYLILEGVGDIVAGEEIYDRTEIRHPAKPGDAFFFTASSLVGFYNLTPGGKHAKILAVRFTAPPQPREPSNQR